MVEGGADTCNWSEVALCGGFSGFNEDADKVLVLIYVLNDVTEHDQGVAKVVACMAMA